MNIYRQQRHWGRRPRRKLQLRHFLGFLCYIGFLGSALLVITQSWWFLLLIPPFYLGMISCVGSEIAEDFFKLHC